MASPPIHSSTDTATKRPCDWRAKRSANEMTSLAATGCSRQQPEWRDERTLRCQRCRNYAACSPTFHWDGSKKKCRSSWMPTESITLKASAAPASHDHSVCASVVRAVRRSSDRLAARHGATNIGIHVDGDAVLSRGSAQPLAGLASGDVRCRAVSV